MDAPATMSGSRPSDLQLITNSRKPNGRNVRKVTRPTGNQKPRCYKRKVTADGGVSLLEAPSVSYLLNLGGMRSLATC